MEFLGLPARALPANGRRWHQTPFKDAASPAAFDLDGQVFWTTRNLRVLPCNPSYKSSGPLEAHFGLAKRDKVDVKVTLLNGKNFGFSSLSGFAELDLKSGKSRPVAATRN